MTRPVFLQYADAIASHGPLPSLSDMTLEQAYAFQQQVTSVRSPAGIAGIKAGVTSLSAQKFLGLPHPLIGSLYADSRLSSGSVLRHLSGRIIECELAILADIDGHPLAVAPAIEFVYLHFADPAGMTVTSLVGSNMGAELFLIGQMLPWDDAPNDVSVELRMNEDVVNTAEVGKLFGGPANAAKWMLEEASARHFSRDGEILLLTGACGSVVPGEKGEYVADFGSLGTVSFSIV